MSGATTLITRDDLGDRMKAYEAESRAQLPARTLTGIRLDGRSFHTWTRGLERPYDKRMIEAMGAVAVALCEEVSGAALAYTQSDEISLLVQDFANSDTQAYFGGRVDKICSITAALASVVFSRHFPSRPPALFDARVFTLPSRVEAANYMLWRQKDARRNAVSMIASHYFSPRQLHGMSTAARRELLAAECGIDVDDADPRFREGQVVERVTEVGDTSYVSKKTGETHWVRGVERCRWQLGPAPRFAAEPGNWIYERIPEPPPGLLATPSWLK